MQTIKNIIAQLDDGRKQAGSLTDLQQGMRLGGQNSTEDARSALWKYRENQGLDEPPQVVEQATRSSVVDALREVASAYLRQAKDESGWLNQLGFSDDMLRHRVENGQSIIDDPTFFDKRELAARQKKAEGIKDEISRRRKGGEDRVKIENEIKEREQWLPDDFADSKQAPLTPAQYDSMLAAAAGELRQEMKAQPALKKVGQVIGKAGADIAEDRTRSLWWLLNAPQAVTSTVADLVVGGVNPNLRSRRDFRAKDFQEAVAQGKLRKIGNEPLHENSKVMDEFNEAVAGGLDEAIGNEWFNRNNFEPASPGVRHRYLEDEKQTIFSERRVNPNKIALFGLGGTALATNAGLGLVGTEDTGIPFVGRREGYGAVVPDSEDKRKSASPVEETIGRYFLSRDGKLLPKREFLRERPDVSPEQFTDYNSYSFDKKTDLNPLDGKINIGGIAKANLNGIHGPEVQFLGQTLSLNEAIVPIAGALAGTALGGLGPNIRQLRQRKHRNMEIAKKRGRTYEPNTSFVGKIVENLPDVARKTYDADADLKLPIIKKGGAWDSITKAFEDRFTETNAVTGKRDMNVGANALAMGIGAGSGLMVGTGIGTTAEEDRRRKNFESWAPPQLDYDVVKANNKAMLDQIKIKEKQLTPEQKGTYKYPSQQTAAMQKEALEENMIQQQSQLDQILSSDDIISNEKKQREAQKLLNQQTLNMGELTALYEG
jgi:hypothetical protein